MNLFFLLLWELSGTISCDPGTFTQLFVPTQSDYPITISADAGDPSVFVTLRTGNSQLATQPISNLRLPDTVAPVGVPLGFYNHTEDVVTISYTISGGGDTPPDVGGGDSGGGDSGSGGDSDKPWARESTLQQSNSLLGDIKYDISSIQSHVNSILGDVSGIPVLILDVFDSVNSLSDIISDIDFSSHFASIGTGISSLASLLSSVNSNISSLNTTASSINSNISSLNTTASSINSNISSLNTTVSSIDSNVSSLNTTVSSIDGKFTTLNNNLSLLNSTATSIYGKINTLNNNVSSLITTASSIDSNVSSLNTTVGSIDVNLNTVKDDVSSIKSDLHSIKEFYDKLDDSSQSQLPERPTPPESIPIPESSALSQIKNKLLPKNRFFNDSSQSQYNMFFPFPENFTSSGPTNIFYFQAPVPAYNFNVNGSPVFDSSFSDQWRSFISFFRGCFLLLLAWCFLKAILTTLRQW